jgi:spermidine/putrescine-binding protein
MPTLLSFKAFEEQNHCKVSASYMGSSDELVAKLRGGSSGNYDVISPSSDVATMIAASGLAAPLDLGKLPSYGQLSPQLTSLSLVRVKGEVYGVPFMWGPDPMIYDTTRFPAASRNLERHVGPEAQGKSFRVGRPFHRLHGRAGARLRQARPWPSL